MKQPLLLPFLFLFTVACGDAPDPTGTPTPTMVAETPTPTATISSQKSEHCGEITTDEIWTEAANPHTLTCSVEIVGGSVTLEAGVVVTVDPGGLSLSVISGGLNLAGNTADPITLKPVAGDSWYGVLIQEGAGDVILTHSKLMGAIQYPGTIDLNTGPLIIRGAEVHIDSVEIEGPTECALVIKDGGRLSDESHGLTVHSSEGWPVCASPLGAGSLPGIEKASNYTGSLTDAVLVTLDYRELASSSSWEDLGIPYLINGPMTVQTDTLDPAILTLEPGVELRFVEEGYLSIGKYTHPGTAGLIVAGTEDKPVLFSGYEGTNPGAWGGVFAYGATDYSLAHLTLENGGFESDGALISHETGPLIDHVLITGSEGLGFSLIDGAAFQAGSTHLSVHNSAVVGQVYGNAVASIPEEGSDYSGNIGAYVSIDGPGGPSRMTKSGTWGDIGVDYKVNGSLDLEGTAASPTILTLDAGAQVSFAPSKYIGIGGLGAAGLKALGTLEKPVVFKASDSLSAGSWAGIYFSSDTVSTETTLEHVEVAFAGADQFYRRQGAIIVDDAHITLSHANIHDSLCNGLAMYGTGTVSGDDSTWTFDAVGCQNIYDEKD